MQLLTVSVKGPNKQEYEGQAVSVTSLNKVGKFDVLPFHTNFISLIKEYIIIEQPDKKKITLPIKSGIMKVYEDKVNILIGGENKWGEKICLKCLKEQLLNGIYR